MFNPTAGSAGDGVWCRYPEAFSKKQKLLLTVDINTHVVTMIDLHVTMFENVSERASEGQQWACKSSRPPRGASGGCRETSFVESILAFGGRAKKKTIPPPRCTQGRAQVLAFISLFPSRTRATALTTAKDDCHYIGTYRAWGTGFGLRYVLSESI